MLLLLLSGREGIKRKRAGLELAEAVVMPDQTFHNFYRLDDRRSKIFFVQNRRTWNCEMSGRAILISLGENGQDVLGKKKATPA